MTEKGPKNMIIKLFMQKSNHRFPHVKYGGSQADNGLKRQSGRIWPKLAAFGFPRINRRGIRGRQMPKRRSGRKWQKRPPSVSARIRLKKEGKFLMKGKNSSGQSHTCDTDFEGFVRFESSENGVAGATLEKRAIVDGVARVTLGCARFSSIPYY